MALPKQLHTSPTRLLGSDLGNTIPAKIGTLESDLCDIFGFTPDVDITASPFSCDNAGNITRSLMLQKFAGTVGWRFLNSASGKEMRIVVNGSNLDFDQNTGSEGSPVWANRFRIAIDTGALTGQSFSASSAGLAPVSDGNSAHFLNASGTYTVPAAVVATSCRLRNSTTQSLPNNTFNAISFDTEDWDSGSMHSGGTPTRIIFPSAGKYLLVGQTGFSANATGRRVLDIKQNGATIVGRAEVDPNENSQTFVTVTGLVGANANDYCELVMWQDSGSTLTTVQGASFTPQFGAYKIGG